MRNVCVYCGRKTIKVLCRRCVDKASQLARDTPINVTCSICGKRTKTSKREKTFICPACKL